MPSSTFLSVLPLRLTKPQQDMMGMMSSWMDSNSQIALPLLSSTNCRNDLATIDRLRQDIAQSLGESKENAYEGGFQIKNKLHTYYNYLLECEENGMVHGGASSTIFLTLEWESALTTGTLQTSHSLEWERANIIWNLATLEAYQASKQPLTTKLSWNKASKMLQNAASWLHQILKLLQDQQQQQQTQQQQQNHYPDISTTFIRFWQALLLAQAQQCIYESLLCVSRPMHGLTAKLAAASVPLYKEVELIIQKDNNNNNNLAMSQCSDLVETWTTFARAWGAYMSCKAEYHQSQIDRDKKLWGQELARLDIAYQHADMCKNICEGTPYIPALDKLRTNVDGIIKILQGRIETAERENNTEHQQKIPKRQELTEIRGEKLVKVDDNLSKLLPSKETEPIFQNKVASVAAAVQNNNDQQQQQQTTTESSSIYEMKAAPVPPNLQSHVDIFQSEMNEIISQIANATEEQTESAKVALAAVNLPHSLTAYRQEQAGGGIPNDLWQRVHTIQQENCIVQLKQDLWELRDSADLARMTYQRMLSQVDSDIESDRLFRQINPTFEGHDAGEAQRTLRRQLTNYDVLLSSAQEGDCTLFKRLEQLDTEPKFNLLQFSKSQLDCLLPSARGDPNDSNNTGTIDTQHLSYLLSELSTLFQEREELVNRIRKELKHYDIQETLQSRVDPVTGSDQDYLEASRFAQKAFDGMIYEIQNNMEKQKEILNTILIENKQFMMNRERTSASQSADSCIVLIEDAIEEIEELSNHLKEGKEFYNAVSPKMDKLKQQIGDKSARLTVERLEYDDKARRASQVVKDAMMAKNLSSESNNNDGGSAAAAASTSSQYDDQRRSPPSNSNGSPSSHPLNNHQEDEAVVPHLHRQETTRTNNVDDEKIATLVGMGFDPDKVVASLEKNNNDVDQALNELLK